MSLDRRAEKLAQVLVDYSVDIQPNDTLLIQGEEAFREFAELVGKLVDNRGARIHLDYFNLTEKRSLIDRNNKEELRGESERICELIENATARIRINATTDTYYLQGIEPKKIADYTAIVTKPFLDRIMGDGKKFKRTKWNLVAFPCEAEAKRLGMSLEEYADFVYNATNIDWKQSTEGMKKVKEVFDNAEDVHIVVPTQTDIHLSLAGRGGEISNGKHNMPGGEVYYGPIEDSANGYIYFPYQTTKEGNLVSGIRLEYKDGEIKSFSAKENPKFLESMLGLKGARRIGELGIGCNYAIKRYVNNCLFDEKIGGTIHLAIGQSFFKPLEQGGGKNDSGIHWDLVCDLRKKNSLPGGELYVDGKSVQKNGIWAFR